MPTRRLLTLCFAGCLAASVASTEELPSIPRGEGLGVASVSMEQALSPGKIGEAAPPYHEWQHVEWFEGNFEDYEQDKVRRLGPDALNPGSQAHKRLTR